MSPESIEALLSSCDFKLDESRIADTPPANRGESRLLHAPASDAPPIDRRFVELPYTLRPGDILIFNDSRVSKRRVELRRQSGARIETLFTEEQHDGTFSALVRNAAKLNSTGELLLHPESEQLFFYSKEPGAKIATLSPRCADQSPGWELGESESFFERYGSIPIPPYLRREATDDDLVRYQTIYATTPGSVAAPTAGLHFNESILKQLQEHGIETAMLTLNVGYGTFAPLEERNFHEKRLHRESFTLPESTATLLASRKREQRVIAVGTTTLRALETLQRTTPQSESPTPGHYTTELFLFPPDQIESIDGLITNFHLPRSSLLLLVAAFAGIKRTKELYHHAIERDYRFYSYGDAMLIEKS